MPAFLVHTSVKATAVLLVAWLLTRAMARCSAAARHQVWALAILAALALPLVQAAAPRWSLPVMAAPAATPAAFELSSTIPVLSPAPLRTIPTAAGHEATASSASLVPADEGDPPPPFAPPLQISWAAAAVAVWIAGLTIALARLAAGLAWISRMRREAADVDDPAWTALRDEIAAAYSITAPVSLKISGDAAIPVTCGTWAPTVVLPPEAAGWPEARRRVVLLHELAHVVRHDCLVRTIAQVVRALHWFNPLAHLAANRLRAEQERAADDVVLAAGTDAPQYADHLVDIARASRGESCPQWATVAMARRSQLEGRLIDILDDQRNRRPPARAVRAALGLSAAALILPIGAVQLTAMSGPVEQPAVASATWARQLAAATVAAARADATQAANTTTGAPQADDQPRPTVSPDNRGAVVRPDVDVDVAIDVADPMPAAIPPLPPTPPPPPAFPWAEPFTRSIVPDSAGGWQMPSPLPSPPAPPARAASPTQDAGVPDETRRRVADALLTALNDENESVRIQALAALAGMRDPRAISGLLKASRDASVGVREQALSALAQFDTPEATQGILAAMKDQNPGVRERAARLMAALVSRGRANDPKYVPALAELLKDAAPDVRGQAVVALGRMRRQEAVPPLLPMLKDMDAGVRTQAAAALGDIADPAAITALSAALKDPASDVREEAARALGQIARGQRRANPVVVPPLPSPPPLPPAARVPQVNLDMDAINKAVQQARETLQRELPTLELQHLDIEEQRRAIEREAEAFRRESASSGDSRSAAPATQLPRAAERRPECTRSAFHGVSCGVSIDPAGLVDLSSRLVPRGASRDPDPHELPYQALMSSGSRTLQDGHQTAERRAPLGARRLFLSEYYAGGGSGDARHDTGVFVDSVAVRVRVRTGLGGIHQQGGWFPGQFSGAADRYADHV